MLHLLDRGRSIEAKAEAEDAEDAWFSPDDVYKAIADGSICFDLQEDLLSETHRVMVYRDRPAMDLGRSLEATIDQPQVRRDVSIEDGCLIDYDGGRYTVVRVGEKTATLKNQERSFDQELSVLLDQHQRGILKIYPKGEFAAGSLASFEHLPPKRVDEILDRMRWLELAKENPEAVHLSSRTLQRYRAMMRKAGDRAVDQKIALASRKSERGNRQRKIPQRLLELVAQVAREHYNTPSNIKKSVAYLYFVQACEREALTPCSEKSFRKELELHKSVRARKGKRSAYQEEPIMWYLKSTEPIHGVRPFQYVHIDHTQLDVLLVSAENRKVLGKPWLTLAVDAESRDIVGFYLSFEAPSYRSCMMVIRDLVRRHGQMPAMLVLDNGKEFHSGALGRVCELYGCSLRYRPAGKPRYGSVMERMFGTTNDQFIHQIEGNTQLMKNPRSLSKAVLPENFAAWTLPQLHGGLEHFFFKVYGTREHPAHGDAPSIHFKRRMTETGERQHRLVRFDEVFRIETCPPPADRPTRRVDPRRGIKVLHLWFWNDVFTRPDLKNEELEVRMDPWDPGTVFVLAKGKWVACRSKFQAMLSKYTEVERRYLFEEIAKRLGGRIGTLTPHRLGEWLHVLEPKNFDPQLAERQDQGKALYGALQMTKAVAAGPSPKPESESPVLPLKVRKARNQTKAEEVVKPAVRRAVTPLEAESDDYSLL